ncbi:N-acetyl-lysine deacetylase [Candidatus Marsarchaeota G1 archaeon OSP_D]|uniref:N-acetyl-lysine deacetylase n=3 Tax=Candidatus Marsarchaeota group 1 TaxID=2203770 RepID=A0A2R6AFS2_9ARCH|nr:MAG: N-acetyl-lysine deacetylase [Candidatus Marsarchaeota G1 archaeon OSP_D]PSN85189.1 MAG: N-acetyl-lysine deacetylase [Candidatus Marsarchaeota G1 archaeon BE_D]PSN87927.1 MAG: N-acetyl-lysine deacetylase [Candidatus Marsarchaeota G1 archaeon OSP_C]
MQDLSASLLKQVVLKLLDCYTPSHKEENAKETVEGIAKALGLKLTQTSSHSYYFGEPSSDIAFVSHIDTVEGFIPVTEERGWIYGRGAVDAKGPLTSMLVAASILSKEGIPVCVFALSCEEEDSEGAQELLQSLKLKYAIVGEPTGVDRVVIEYRGSAKIVLTLKGKKEHAASASENLLLNAAQGILNLPPSSYELSLTPVSLECETAWNVTPSEIKIRIGARFSKNYTGDFVKQVLDAFNAPEKRVTVLEKTQPVFVEPTSIVPRTLVRVIQQLGKKPAFAKKHGTSDMNLLAPICTSIAAYGPGDPRLAHTDEERVSVEELLFATKVYAAFAKSLVKPL